MPRFYFHVFDGRAVLDTDGTDLLSSKAAQVEAVRLAGAILRDEAARVAVGEDWHMEVTDQRGLILFRLDFSLSAAPAVGSAPVPTGRSSAEA